MLHPFPKYLLMILSNRRHGAGQHFVWTNRPFLWFTVRSRVGKQTLTTLPLVGLNCFKYISNMVKGPFQKKQFLSLCQNLLPISIASISLSAKIWKWLNTIHKISHNSFPTHSITLRHTSLTCYQFHLVLTLQCNRKQVCIVFSHL